MSENASKLESVIKAINDNVDMMVFNLFSFTVDYTKWVDYYLEYRVLKRYNDYVSDFVRLARELGNALYMADVNYTKEEETSYNEWHKQLSYDLGYSKKLEKNKFN